jgi:hypothetical protein
MCLGKHNASKEFVWGEGWRLELYVYAFLILALCEGKLSFTSRPLNPWEITTSIHRIWGLKGLTTGWDALEESYNVLLEVPT